MVVVAGGEKGGIEPDLAAVGRDTQTQPIAVETDRAVELRDVQVHVADTNGGMNGFVGHAEELDVLDAGDMKLVEFCTYADRNSTSFAQARLSVADVRRRRAPAEIAKEHVAGAGLAVDVKRLVVLHEVPRHPIVVGRGAAERSGIE